MVIKGKMYYPTFHTTNTPIARKAWKCTLCGEPVTIGERYVRYTWRKEIDGDQSIDDLPFHPECWAYVKHYCKMTNTNVFSAKAVNDWYKTRRHCRMCKEPECCMSKCEKLKKYAKYKPIQSYYDKVLARQAEKAENGFKIIDE